MGNARLLDVYILESGKAEIVKYISFVRKSQEHYLCRSPLGAESLRSRASIPDDPGCALMFSFQQESTASLANPSA